MKIFLDFDDTLFNTAAFIGASRSLFVDFGISEEMYKDAWQKVREWRGLESLSYDFEAHMKELHKKKDFDDEESRKKVEDFYQKRTREYVFSDAEGFLQKMRDRGNTLYLVSFKTGDFQDKKIAASGLAEYFDALATGPEEKGEVLRQFFGGNEEVGGYFVDDRLHQIESVKRVLPKIVTIHIQRREGRYHDEPNEFCDYIVKDLIEAEKVISDSFLKS